MYVIIGWNLSLALRTGHYLSYLYVLKGLPQTTQQEVLVSSDHWF